MNEHTHTYIHSPLWKSLLKALEHTSCHHPSPAAAAPVCVCVCVNVRQEVCDVTLFWLLEALVLQVDRCISDTAHTHT